MRTAYLNLTVVALMTAALVVTSYFTVPLHYKMCCILLNSLSAVLALGFWMHTMPYVRDAREGRSRVTSFFVWSALTVAMSGCIAGATMLRH